MQLEKRDYWGLGLVGFSIFGLVFGSLWLNSQTKDCHGDGCFGYGFILIFLYAIGLLLYFIGVAILKNLTLQWSFMYLALIIGAGYVGSWTSEKPETGLLWAGGALVFIVLTKVIKNPLYKIFLWVLAFAALVYFFI